MNPIRRELLNGVFVLVVASLMSAAFAAFQLSFNVQLWVLILMAIGIAVSGYVMFEIALGHMSSSADREKEWLKRVGTPARFAVGELGIQALREALQAMSHGDYTVMNYVGPEGGGPAAPFTGSARETTLSLVLEQFRRGVIREYKRIICFDHDVLANDAELRSGVLRVGEGPGTIDGVMGNHCRLMMESKGCSLFVAPAVLAATVVLYGMNTAAMTVENAAAQDTRIRAIAGVLFFSDPPNGEIIEQFRQLERATERRMIAVHKIVFPEDAVSTAQVADR
jgi:hypothetical protein